MSAEGSETQSFNDVGFYVRVWWAIYEYTPLARTIERFTTVDFMAPLFFQRPLPQSANAVPNHYIVVWSNFRPWEAVGRSGHKIDLERFARELPRWSPGRRWRKNDRPQHGVRLSRLRRAVPQRISRTARMPSILVLAALLPPLPLNRSCVESVPRQAWCDTEQLKYGFGHKLDELVNEAVENGLHLTTTTQEEIKALNEAHTEFRHRHPGEGPVFIIEQFIPLLTS